ncbi:non-ribosomal peptide synthetase [Aquimarina algiphila]|uniref:non-ribosomal peptide synthetase n=1 Tax=Aquimarina algiphila TaxID=2047982 RepID=UPI00232DA1B7|nr:amino acid adenylation domain-containing protein [Aquimarina algiphila]
MIAKKILDQLLDNGFCVSHEGDNLVIDGDVEKLEQNIINKIKLYKAEIIEILRRDLKDFTFESIEVAPKKELYLATPAQKRIFLTQQLDPLSTAYNMTDLFVLGEKEIDSEKIWKTFEILIERHESLRTGFQLIDGHLKQKIHNKIDFSLEESEINDNFFETKLKEFVEPFDLSWTPLLRAELVHIKSKHSILFIDIHHIICDFISQKILKQDFYKIYNNIELEPLSLQYKDYSYWVTQKKQNNDFQLLESFWVKKIKNNFTLLELPYDYKRPLKYSYHGARVNFLLTKESISLLKKISLDLDLTFPMLFLGVFKILLFKISGQSDINIGMPVTGRNHIDLQNIVGVFINSIVIRSCLDSSMTIKDYLLKIRELMLEAIENQDYPFEELADKVLTERDPSRNPVFDVMFNYINQIGYKRNSFKTSIDKHYPSSSKFDLTFTVIEQEDNLLFTFNYRTSLFKASSINKYVNYFKRIINIFPQYVDKEIKTLDILSNSEKFKLINIYNTTTINHFISPPIHKIFENQVTISPDKIAIVFGETKLTYLELNQKSNQLAQFLLDKVKGCRTGEVVGLFFDVGPNLIVSMIALMKIGVAYIPINEESPELRIEYILRKSKCELILTNDLHYSDKVKNYNGKWIEVNEKVFVGKDENLNLDILPSSILYIIFTSGTTGFPKGVKVKHESLFNYVQWFSKTAEITSLDKTMLLTHHSFDLGYTVLYSSILNGCELHLLRREKYLSSSYLKEYIYKSKVSYLKLTPSFYNSIIDIPGFKEWTKYLRLVVLGGEMVNLETLKKSISLNKNIKIINHYGPTEATIGCIAYEINPDNLDEFIDNPVIGNPIFNMKAYICDNDLNLVPLGSSGELCVSGIGVSLGYINDEELTSEKFVSNPFDISSIIYKTGDMVKRRKDGLIQFLGRIDDQVKINGYRVEIKGVEKKLQSHPEVNDVVVIYKNKNTDGHNLYAYYTSKNNISIKKIKEFLSSQLPKYMIPTYIERLDQIPLTLNGKVDRQKLYSRKVIINKKYVGASNEDEKKLAKIWSNILSIEYSKISIEDSFFSLGGNSLKAFSLISKIEEEFNVTISINDIFSFTTIRELSIYIKEKINEEDYLLIEELEQMNDDDLLDLLDG